MKTYNDLYMTTRSTLKRQGVEAYAQEARILVSAAAGKTVTELLRDLNLYTTPQVENAVTDYTARRLRGEPVAYITGAWEFYGLPMKVTSDVLIPRPDTEVLVDAVKDVLIGYKMDARVLDLCCGSGCITCAVGHELPATKLVAVDLSASALEVCRANINLNRLTTRVICMQADATAAPPLGIGSFDVIVSNPPYIKSAEIETLDRSVKDYEPIWALDGGADGLRFYKSIIKYWKSLLRPDGVLIFEVGEGQADDVADMLLAAGFDSCSVRRDTRGTERCVIGRM
ncbi:MAG: peptide chain release factor N(5)-glutamine methyltransferase [Oscillospiraceae bacterium]|nr:peptide chain release factor N(5)-glutamine methyltransferase [Oscillospiraceae bacterium]